MFDESRVGIRIGDREPMAFRWHEFQALVCFEITVGDHSTKLVLIFLPSHS